MHPKAEQEFDRKASKAVTAVLGALVLGACAAAALWWIFR